MGTAELKGNINRMLNNVNDERFLNIVYVILKEYSANETALTNEQLAELELRVKRYDQGKTDHYPWKDSLNAIRAEIGK